MRYLILFMRYLILLLLVLSSCASQDAAEAGLAAGRVALFVLRVVP